jgi:hypothetical protein
LGYPLLPSPYPEQHVPIPVPPETAWLSISSSIPASVHHETSPPCGALWEGKWRKKLLNPEISSHIPALSNLPASIPENPVLSPSYAPNNSTSPQTLHENPSISIPPLISFF